MEFRDHAVRMLIGVMKHNGLQGAMIMSVAEGLGRRADTVDRQVRRLEVDCGRRAGVMTGERQRLWFLKLANRELQYANESL